MPFGLGISFYISKANPLIARRLISRLIWIYLYFFPRLHYFSLCLQEQTLFLAYLLLQGALEARYLLQLLLVLLGRKQLQPYLVYQ